MTKTVDLVSYLPPFMADFKEISVTLSQNKAESYEISYRNTEF